MFHCIDHLREIIMCHGNIAVHTFEWKDEFTFPFMKRQTEHVCRKWEPLVAWARANSPDRSDGGPILRHPVLGTCDDVTVVCFLFTNNFFSGIIHPKAANLTQA
ncbi:hypothetical protein MKX07_005057 [Trichoderma sp. CBMAI-0711]|nr:hypothetical protein MKX07_005057 [Trichoderma sp. CBMAI-0711]